MVYFSTGSSCDASYIGQTTRYLEVRIQEHLKGRPKSVIYDHLQSNHSNAKMKFEVLCKCYNSNDLILLESIMIKFCQPTLNTQCDNNLCSL